MKNIKITLDDLLLYADPQDEDYSIDEVVLKEYFSNLSSNQQNNIKTKLLQLLEGEPLPNPKQYLKSHSIPRPKFEQDGEVYLILTVQDSLYDLTEYIQSIPKSYKMLISNFSQAQPVILKKFNFKSRITPKEYQVYKYLCMVYGKENITYLPDTTSFFIKWVEGDSIPTVGDSILAGVFTLNKVDDYIHAKSDMLLTSTTLLPVQNNLTLDKFFQLDSKQQIVSIPKELESRLLCYIVEGGINPDLVKDLPTLVVDLVDQRIQEWV